MSRRDPRRHASGPGGPGPGLVLGADLDVSVVSPSGRRGTLRLDDVGGVLVVRVRGLRALVSSLPPLGPGAARPGDRHRLGRARRSLAAAWRQPVDVHVGERLVARRRQGRWRPAPAVLRPALVTLVAGLGAVAALLVRRRRAAPPGGRSRSSG